MNTITDLVGRNEIAKLAGVELVTVDKWRTRYDTFPGPITRLSGTPLWDRRDVVKWLERTGRTS